MRILMATPFLPTAGSPHGGGTYLHALLEALTPLAQVDLVSFATPAELTAAATPPPGLASARIVARPDRGDAATFRVAVRHRLAMLDRWTRGGLPVTVAKFGAPAFGAVLADAVARTRPDAVLFEMDLLAQFLGAAGDRPTILTDHEAAHAVPAPIGPGGLGRARDARLWQAYIERTYPRASLLQALNDDDAAQLTARFGRPVAVRPATVRLPQRAAAPDRAPPRALFFGDFRHAPNPEAARFLLREVLPRILSPGARLTIAGRGSEAVAGEVRDPRVEVAGYVDDLGALLDATRVVVAPVFSGGGTRIKVLTALARGVPVVANALGLRGLAHDTPGVERIGSAADCAAAVDRWLGAPVAAAHAGAAGRAWIRDHLSPTAVARAQVERIAALLADRLTSR